MFKDIIEFVTVVIIGLILMVSCVKADTLYIGQKTRHFNKDETIERESHFLLGYERKNVIVAYWRNSFDKHTVFLGYRWKYADCQHEMCKLYGGVNYGIKFGAVSGYDFPAAAMFYFQNDLLDVNILPGVVGVGLKFDF